jgi:hypothetical protein
MLTDLRRLRSSVALIAIVVSWLASPADTLAQKPEGIQDNSFLIEEAYNQESGVVQHIGTFQLARGARGFDGSFTQEWPLGGIRHQLSYSIPVLRADGATGVGDIDLNYRYQLVGDGDAVLAIAPRFTIAVPTGDWKQGRGRGAVGAEVAMPVSYVLSPLLTTHFNISAALTPRARVRSIPRATVSDFSVGGSAIVTALSNLHFLVEGLLENERVEGEDTRAAVISPGVRGALNFESGLQIVPGIAFPIGIGPSAGERGVFFYLSFEHPFQKAKP